MDISRLIIPLITYLLTLNHNYLPRHLLINTYGYKKEAYKKHKWLLSKICFHQNELPPSCHCDCLLKTFEFRGQSLTHDIGKQTENLRL